MNIRKVVEGMQKRWLPRSEKRKPSDFLPRALCLTTIAAAAAILATIFSLLPLAGVARAASPTIVSLTFDDGRATAYTARSILANHNMHATFFVNSPLLSSSSFYMTWPQVGDLYNDGNEIGGHTAYHVNLPQIDPTEAQRQICDDRVNLLNHGYPATDFAYPYGAYSGSIESMVQACGYNSARTTDVPSGGAESIPPANPYAIRMGSGSGSLSALESAVSSAEAAGGGWVPLVLHDICSGCSTVSISQTDFTSLLDWLQGQNTNGVVVETVAQVVGGTVQPAVAGPAAPPPATGTNGLRNASLELNTNAASAPNCWQYDGYGQNSFTWTRTTAAHSGTYAEQVNVSNYSSGDNKLMVLQDLGACSPSVTSGHQYLISSWYNSSLPVYFTVFARDTQYAFSYWQTSPDFPTSSGWAQASWLTPPIPSTITALSFGLTVGGNGSLTVDDLSIVDSAGTTTDKTPPSVSLTAPSSGTTLSGQVQLSANASDNVALDHVEFLVDGTTVGSAVDSSITYSWNSRTVANGNHTFAARAVDTSGNTTTSPSVTAYVNNQSNNLLQNPSLEQASGNTPTCWTLGGYGTNTYSWTYTTDAHTGSHAENLSISSWTSGDRKLINTQDNGTCAPAVTPGHTYTTTAWYKTSTNAQPYIFVYYRTSSGSWVYWTQSARLAVASSWTLAGFTTPAVPAGATNISVGIGESGVGSVTMDDFGLYDNSPPPDTTPPTSSITCNNNSSEGGCATYFSGPALIQLSAVDNPGGSGVAKIVYTTNGSDPSLTNGTVYSGPFTTTTTVKYRAYDNAGNAEAVNSQPISIDSLAPASTIACNSATCGSGYYNSAVSVTLAATDTGGSGVESIRYTTDGSDPSLGNGSVYIGAFSIPTTRTVKYRAYDNAGNAEPINSQLIRIDTTPPTSSIACNGSACLSNTYNAAVSVSLAATDNSGGSGIAKIVYTTDGSDPSTTNGTTYSAAFSVASTTTVKYRAYDNAGNAEPINSQLIQLDTTPPASSIACNSAACGSGYFKAAVSVSLAATDNPGGSGVASIVYTTDGSDPSTTNGTTYSAAFSVTSTTTVKYRAYDNAGNAEPINSQLIQVDTTPPTSSIACNSASCLSSTYNAAVSVSLVATDNTGGSGVAKIVYTTDGSDPSTTNGNTYGGAFSVASTTTVKYRAYDNAGNVEPINSQLIQVQIVPPGVTLTNPANGSTVSGSVTLSASVTGMTVDHVDFLVDGTVVGTSTNSPYGVSWDSTKVGDGSHTILARAYDTSGQSTDSATATVTVSNTVTDTTPPTSTISCNGSACGSGYFNAAVSVSLSAMDNPGGSGVASIVYTTDGTDPSTTNGTTYSAAFSVTSTTTVKYRAYDNAGNAEPINSQFIQIDTTPPTSSIACNSVACLGSTYNATVSVSLGATDNPGGSGIAKIVYTTDGSDPSTTNGTTYSAAFSVTSTTTVKYRAYDNAGNAEPINSQFISIDTTPPTSSIACNGSACGSGYYNAAVSISLAALDNPGGSGVASIVYTTDGSDPSTTHGTTYSAAFSVASTTTVKYRAYDNAGNAEPINSQFISIDTTPPTSSIACNGSACGGGYYNAAVSVSLGATDNSGGSGIAKIVYTTDGSDPSTTNGNTYGGAFSVASTTTVKYRAYDNAGNVEPINSQLIQVDSIVPTSSIACNGLACASSYYNAAVSVSLAATDNPGGSGVAKIVYTTDGTNPSTTNGTTYSAAFSVTSTTTVKYRAYDNAGNAEPVNTALLQVDTTAPTSTIACNGSACGSGYFNAAVSVSLSATDNTGGSGVATIRYTTDGSDPSTTNGTTYSAAFSVTTSTTVKYRAYDKVGNAEAVNSRLISIDTIAPTVSVTAPSANALLSGTVNLTANASDNVAVDHVDFLVDGKVVATATSAPYSVSWNSTSVPDGLHTITARAVDSAGNATTSAAVSVNVTNNNLLQNPSLEQATNGVPTCWLLGGSGTNTYSWTYTTDAHTGSHAENLSISAWTSGDRKLVNTQDSGTCAPAITPGHTYTVTAWYKSNTTPYIYVYYRNSSGSWVYWTQSAKLAVASSWTQASFTTPAVPSGATNISVGMGMSGVGWVTMDDFGLYATS